MDLYNLSGIKFKVKGKPNTYIIDWANSYECSIHLVTDGVKPEVGNLHDISDVINRFKQGSWIVDIKEKFKLL